jgi:nucleotide-binding universal stress UspA family protein
MYTHILVPTDGSELAQNGVDHALSLAKALGSKVTVITATEPFPFIYSDGWVPSEEDVRQFEERQEQGAAETLAKVKAQADGMGVPADTVHAPKDKAASAIVETAQRLGCNLIVMSSHGRRGIVRMLLGSQASEVLANSTVPVLVVRQVTQPGV